MSSRRDTMLQERYQSALDLARKLGFTDMDVKEEG
jgi:hypothetical protein